MHTPVAPSLQSARAAGASLHPSLLTAAIAAAYFAAGKLSLLLAIPPGYATAVWPPAGIALAAMLLYGGRAWSGILIGSLLANLSTSLDTTSATTIARSIAIAASVAGGAALQAALGSWLIRRFAPRAVELTNERDVFSLFALAGPLACLANSTVGVATLVLSGAVPASAATFSWWTWWVGDSIGTLIFAPLMLMWLGERMLWQTRRSVVTIALLSMLGAAILVFVYASRSEERELRTHFNEDASRVATDIERRLELDVETLRAAGGLFVASERVAPAEFARLAELLLPARPEFRALAWAPRMTAAQRDSFEAELRARGVTRGILDITERGLASAAPRAEYFPMSMIQTGGARGRGIGIDLAGIASRREALLAAIDAGKVVATRPVALFGERAAENGVVLVMPVLDGKDVQGLVVGSLNSERLVVESLRDDRTHARLRLAITDVTAPQLPEEQALVYRTHVDSHLPAEHNIAALDLSMTTTLAVAGRTWQLEFTPTLAYLEGSRSVVAWLVLACGLVLTALVGAGALILTGRTHEISALVSTRTEELARINEQLAEEICEHIVTEQKLDQEREFLHTVLENLNEGILVFDESGKVTMSNRAAREVHKRIVGDRAASSGAETQFELRESDGRTPLALDAYPRERALRGETVRDAEVVAVAPARKPVNLMVTSQPLLSAVGERSGAITLVRDISDAKRADRLKSEFVSVVSHELRTPLTSIRGSIGLVCGGASGELPPKAKQLLDIAYRNTDRLTMLINDILDMEKIEAGQTQLDVQCVDIGQLLEQALEANAGYATNYEVQLHLQRPAPRANVNADPHRLLQVMANLLSNAAKFSPRGASVDVSAVVYGSRVRIRVRDAGPGIPPEFHSRIFQKFSQADGSDSRDKPGTGLGLAISKALIERMGGIIAFESQPGSGALFYFELPLLEVTR